MKRFNPFTSCVKCGCLLSKTHFSEGAVDILRRECLNCGYKWYERPLDYQP